MPAVSPTTAADSSPAPRSAEPVDFRSEAVWPREIELLLSCSRLHIEESSVSRIRQILQKDLDWDRLYRLTVLHCVTAFLFRHLDAIARDLVPDPFMQSLRGRFLHDGAAALRNTSHLLELREIYQEQGILAVPYKGPALALSVYGNIAFRRCNDLDILVSRSDVPRSRTILEEAGYTPVHPITDAGREFLLQKRHSEIFARPSGPIIELHWAFAKQRGLFPLDLDMLRPRLQKMSLAGSVVDVFAPEDQLLILSVHGANHLWSRLEWLCGISELLRRNSLAWPEVLLRARELRSRKALDLGLVLAHDLLGAPVPQEILDDARAGGDVSWAARLVKKKFSSGQIERPEERSSIERDMFRLRLQSTNGARIRYLMHRMTIPGRDDTRFMVPVGKRFVPLPSVLRPFHILGKLLGTVMHRNTSDRGQGAQP